jgi:ribosomal protein S18 acetylase RimI-like enzyme
MTEATSTPAEAAPDGITIRRATCADAALIYRLIRELAGVLGAEARINSTAEDFAREGFGDDPAFVALIAERQAEPIGLCLFFESFSSWNGRRGVYVQDLYVADSARGLGLGRRLLAAAAAIVHRRGGRYLRLSVDADNALAQAFYERIGLRHSSTERIYQVRDEEFAALAGSAEGAGP